MKGDSVQEVVESNILSRDFNKHFFQYASAVKTNDDQNGSSPFLCTDKTLETYFNRPVFPPSKYGSHTNKTIERHVYTKAISANDEADPCSLDNLESCSGLLNPLFSYDHVQPAFKSEKMIPDGLSFSYVRAKNQWEKIKYTEKNDADKGYQFQPNGCLNANLDANGIQCCCESGIGSQIGTNMEFKDSASKAELEQCRVHMLDKFTCGFCQGVFSGLCLLYQHLKTHSGNGSFVLDGKTKTAYPRMDLLCRNTQTDQLMFIDCSERDENTVTKDLIDQHAKSASLESKFCLRKRKPKIPLHHKYENDSELPTRMDVYHNRNTYTVKNEGHSFRVTVNHTTKTSINEDEKIKKGNATDDSCDTDKYTIDELSENKQTRLHSEKTNKSFMTSEKKRRSFVRNYIRKGEKFICKVCNDCFQSYKHFTSHFRSSHGQLAAFRHSNRKPTECVWCGKAFPSAKMCLDHIKECEENKRMQCQICKIHFSELTEVDEHILSHTDFELSCKQCSKAFTNPLYLHNHLLRHADVRNVQCEHCGKCVNGGRTLKVHLKTCNKDHNLPCPHCDKMFKTRNGLKFHMSVHSDERPFVCHICGHAGTLKRFIAKYFSSIIFLIYR